MLTIQLVMDSVTPMTMWKIPPPVSHSMLQTLGGRSQFLMLLTLADLLVTNDSGPAHFAALTGIDVITLFGPETPAVFGVKGPRSHIIHAGLPCSPCVNAANNRMSACTNNLCMQAITVEQVFDRVCEVLAIASQRVRQA